MDPSHFLGDNADIFLLSLVVATAYLSLVSVAALSWPEAAPAALPEGSFRVASFDFNQEERRNAIVSSTLSGFLHLPTPIRI